MVLISGVLATLVSVITFSVSFYYILHIHHSIIAIEEEMNQKFRKMFNAIQDGVILVKSNEVNFMNQHAKGLLRKCDDPFSTPFIYLFSDVDGKDN